MGPAGLCLSGRHRSHSQVFQGQGAQGQLRAVVTEHFAFEAIRGVSFPVLLLFLILNEKPAFLPLSLLVGVPTLVSGGGVAFQNGMPTSL